MYKNLADDSELGADEFASAVATMQCEPEAETTKPEWTGPSCEKCGSPSKSAVVTICRKCGWYASLNRFVEVDSDWETEDSTDGIDGTAMAVPQKSHLRVWFDLLPRWSWYIIASVLAITLESVAARFVTPAGSPLRTLWSLGQLTTGVLVFASCHLFNFLVLAAEDADVGVIDLVLKPIKLWMRAFQNLPNRLWVSNLAVSSIWAAVMSLLVIGGIPYERLWDWGFEPPAKQELMGAVMDRVKKLDNQKGADNLEDAVGDFAGKEGLEEAKPEKPRQKADCVILGYQSDRDGRLGDLILGTNYLGKLVYAGRVTPQMSSDELESLTDTLRQIRTQRKLLPIRSDTTTWVEPKLACRVTYSSREKGRLFEVLWDRLLGRIGPQ